MNELKSVLYTAVSTSTGGRTGTSRSNDGRLDLILSTPKALGGDDGAGTNPEQLFSAGYAACFIGAMKVVAGHMKLPLGDDVSVTAHVDIGPIDHGFGIAVKLEIDIPSLSSDQSVEIMKAAHKICPYSNATRGNIDVQLTLKA